MKASFINSVVICGTLFASTVSMAAINPSRAFKDALALGETVILKKHPGFEVTEVKAVEIGKFSPGEFGDYTVRLDIYSEPKRQSFTCETHLNIRKVPAAKQDPRVAIILEDGNKYQIIARVHNAYCD